MYLFVYKILFMCSAAFDNNDFCTLHNQCIATYVHKVTNPEILFA